LFDRFENENLSRKNSKGLLAFEFDDPETPKSTDGKYDFINAKAAAKCVKVRKSLKEAGFNSPDFPEGYYGRNGQKIRRVFTPADINTIFSSSSADKE